MQKALPAKEITFTIKGNPYTIKFPSTGEFIEIQCLKSKITHSNYNSLSQSDDYNSSYAKLLVDMCATYNVMLPGLKKDINIDGLLRLSMLESRELLDPYIEIYVPWHDEWVSVITAVKSKEEDQKEA